MNKLKAIKIIVSFLTFLFVLGMLFALTIIIKKVKKPVFEPENTLVNLNMPLGCEIKSVTHKNDYTYILVKGQGCEDRIAILDSANENVATILLNEVKNEQN